MSRVELEQEKTWNREVSHKNYPLLEEHFQCYLSTEIHMEETFPSLPCQLEGKKICVENY